MRKRVIWILAACLLLAGCGGKTEEAPAAEQAPEAPAEEIAVTPETVPERVAEPLGADYDFTHDGAADTLELITVPDPDTGEDLWYELWLQNGAGERVWSYTMAAGGPSWDLLLFVMEQDGQDCILELATSMGQGYCSYFYEVFALTETGERVPRERGEVQFDVNFGSRIHEPFDIAAVADFLWRVKELTAQADRILMDVDVKDGLRCMEPASVFTHDYHFGKFTALDSREEIETQIAYAMLLAGDTTLLEPADVEKWGLSAWTDTILPCGNLEYTCLDLDRDGGEELLLQWVDAPENYNGVFHYDGSQLRCWQNDSAEGNCRDYPLQDGTMVRQYDFNENRTYTLFRYRSDGSTKELTRLTAREEPLDPDSGEESTPYYEVDGESVDLTEFKEWIYDLITSQRLDSEEWSAT